MHVVVILCHPLEGSFRYCGIEDARCRVFPGVRTSSYGTRKAWLDEVGGLVQQAFA
jgi:hypothetical protein